MSHHSRHAHDRYDEEPDYSRNETNSRHHQLHYLSDAASSSARSAQLVHVPKPTWPAAGSTPFATTTSDSHTYREGPNYAAREEEHAHASSAAGFLDANEISHCRLEGENSRAYSGCLIVSDRPVRAPIREARNRIAGVTTAADGALLDCGPRILSEAAFRVMAEMGVARGGRR